LAIDGGGVRGIIPSRILAEIELRTKRSISDIFRIFGGTSTGAIVSSSLNIPDNSIFCVGSMKPRFTANDIVKIYTERGTDIFPKGGWIDKSIIQKTSNMFISCKYESQGLEKVLKE
jgi:patatin-like phospholipase/acyl hydrolase